MLNRLISNHLKESLEKMDASKKIIYSLLIACLLNLTPAITSAQTRDIQTVIAKVLNLDTGIFNNDFALKINMKPRRYYYAVYHLNVVSSTGDTLVLGYVFDIKKHTTSALAKFSSLNFKILRA